MAFQKNRLWHLAQRLEWWWWRKYLHNKDTDTYLSWKRQYWSDFVMKLPSTFHHITQKNILDAGCGPAGIFMIMGENTVTALDPLLNQYDTLAHFDRQQYPYCTFINSSIESYSPTHPYDYVFSLNAINHVADLPLCIRNIYGYLRDGGTAIISTDVHRYPLLKKLLRIIPTDALHPQQDDAKDYINILEKTGFKHIEILPLEPENPLFDYVCFIAKK